MANRAINVRSPYILSVTGIANESTRCELFIWNSPNSIPLTPTRVLSKPIPSSIQTTVYYDVSEYCRDFINHENFVEVTAPTSVNEDEYCYCTALLYLDGVLEDTIELTCFDGYGYFLDGANPEYSEILMDEGTYQIKTNANSGAITTNVDTTVDDWSIRYEPLTGVGSFTQALTDIDYSPYIHNSYKGTGGNKVQILKTVGITTTVEANFTFLEVCEPKYAPINLDFVNKYGAWQRIICFKASFDNFDMTNNEFNMMSPTPFYSTYQNRKQSFNTNGTDKIRVNTGLVDESYKDVIKQIMLSEKIMLDNKPVKITSKGVELHKGINKKIINYEMTFEYSFQTVNNIQ